MNKVLPVSCAVLLLSAAGCNDGMSVTKVTVPDVLPPLSTQTPDCSTESFVSASVLDALPGGIWQGTLVDCANDTRQELTTVMVSEDGRFRIIANEHLLAGSLQTSGDLFRGGGIDFAPPGVEYFSGPTTNLFVEGRIDERQVLEGRWGTEWGHYGYFTFYYDQQAYERPTSLADLAGVWPSYATHSGSPIEGVWTIEPDGRFNGQDALGCLQSGQFSLIDDRYSIVSVQLTILGCELAGSFSGLARREDLVDWWEHGINMSVDDGARAFRILLAVGRP